MTDRIPRSFHFVFGLKPQREPFHIVHWLCLESCIRVNRPEMVNLYYRHLPWGPHWDRIRDQLVLHQLGKHSDLDAYEYPDGGVGHYRYAHESDFIRLEKLVSHGGIYADMDTLFVNPLPDSLFEKPFVLGREQDLQSTPSSAPQPSLCNAFIMAPAGSEFGRLWLERSRAAFDGSWSAHSCQLAEALSRERPDWIHIEPRRSFYNHASTVEGIRTLFEGCDPDFEGIYSMHLWQHVWAARWRRDFTHFHQGKLTENYLRNFTSTYSLAARRYLPGATSEDVTAALLRPVSRHVAPIDRWTTRAGLLALSWWHRWDARRSQSLFSRRSLPG